jgi:hypothetical protein
VPPWWLPLQVMALSDDETNSCVYTRPDGDQVFTKSKASGKLAGITGSGEFTRTSVRPVAEGGSLSYARSRSSYKLPWKTPGARTPVTAAPDDRREA